MSGSILRRPSKKSKISKNEFIKESKFEGEVNFPWDSLDPNAEHDKTVKGSTVNISFNEWEINVLKYLAKQEKRSLKSYLILTLKKHALRKVKTIN